MRRFCLLCLFIVGCSASVFPPTPPRIGGPFATPEVIMPRGPDPELVRMCQELVDTNKQVQEQLNKTSDPKIRNIYLNLLYDKIFPALEKCEKEEAF